jgi:hypothetical protein
MPTFITIGYGDSAGYERTEAALREATHPFGQELEVDRDHGPAGRPR